MPSFEKKRQINIVIKTFSLFSMLTCVMVSCFQNTHPPTESATLKNDPLWPEGMKLIKTIDHEPNSFTQGLVFHDGYLYEGTGLTGESEIKQIDL